MGRSRYKIYEPTHPHFITLTILHGIPVFTNKDSIQIVIDSLQYLQREDNLKIYAYVILENHIHLVACSNDIAKTMQKFKSYTAKELIGLLKSKNITTLLEQFAFYKKQHKKHTKYQIWKEGIQPKLIQNEKMMLQKIEYVHQNPVKRGFVDRAEHWRYSSARDYLDISGLIEIEKLF